jgi:hypothetical protein
MIFLIKLNDNKNGLASSNIYHQQIAIFIHKILQKNNIKITDFDYIPDFGISNSDWIDNLHWNNQFFIKWSNWIINKILNLLCLYKINYSKKKKILILSDSTLDYTIINNRKKIFKNIMISYDIPCKIIAKGGGSFSSKYKSTNFYYFLNSKKYRKKNYAAIIIIGGINDCFCNNKTIIKKSINRFAKLAKKIIQ